MAGRRAVLKGALGASGTAAAVACLVGADSAAGRRGPFRVPVQVRWLGVAGWEIVIDGNRSILFDPYVSRMPYTNGKGITEPGIPLATDRAAVEEIASGHLTCAPELILVSHGHFDHLADVPHFLAHPAWRRSRIRTLCDATVASLLSALGTEPRRTKDILQVRGGEYLQFEGYTVEVFRSLHSQSTDYGYFAPGTLIAPPRRPTTLGELVEGQTLAYQVSVEGGPSILLMGASNFIERELSGIRPDAAAVPLTTLARVHRYTERLLAALGNPPVLLPSHHDDMITPLTAPPRTLAASVTGAAVHELTAAAGAGSRVVAPRHLEAVDLVAELART